MNKELREVLEQLNATQERASAISKEVETASETRCAELGDELDTIEERTKELMLKKQELEEKEKEERAEVEAVENGKGKEVVLPTEERKMEINITKDMMEY